MVCSVLGRHIYLNGMYDLIYEEDGFNRDQTGMMRVE